MKSVIQAGPIAGAPACPSGESHECNGNMPVSSSQVHQHLPDTSQPQFGREVAIRQIGGRTAILRGSGHLSLLEYVDISA